MPLPITDNEKKRMTYQVFSLFTQYGFDGISMDEVAKRIKLSKATLYKYIKSKENIVREMVNELIKHMDAVNFTADNGIEGVLESISLLYFKAVIMAAHISPQFLSDLQDKFPDIYKEYILALESMQKRFEDFYEQAAKKGYCIEISISLVGEQLKLMLPSIINTDYIQKHKTTLPDVIMDYYRLLLHQLISEKYKPQNGQEDRYLAVQELIEILNSRFLTFQNIEDNNE